MTDLYESGKIDQDSDIVEIYREAHIFFVPLRGKGGLKLRTIAVIQDDKTKSFRPLAG